MGANFPRTCHIQNSGTMISSADAQHYDVILRGLLFNTAQLQADAVQAKALNPTLKLLSGANCIDIPIPTNDGMDSTIYAWLEANPTYILRQVGSRMVLAVYSPAVGTINPAGTPDGNGDTYASYYVKRAWDAGWSLCPAVDGCMLDVMYAAPLLTFHSNLEGGALGIGTVSATGTTSQVTDSGKAWTVNQFTNFFVTILAGTGAYERRKIASNTATVLTTATPFTLAPVGGGSSPSQYVIEGYSNTATAFSANTIGDGVARTVNKWQYSWVEIVSGTGAGQIRLVSSSNASGLMTTLNNWTVTPDGTSVFEVHAPPNENRLAVNTATGRALANLNSNDLIPAQPYESYWTDQLSRYIGTAYPPLRARAIAAGRPNFMITMNNFIGVMRNPYARRAVNGGLQEGWIQEVYAYGYHLPGQAVKVGNLLGNETINTDPYILALGSIAALTNYDAMRFQLAACLMTNSYNFSGTGYSTTTPTIYDEYRLDIGTAVDPVQNAAQGGKAYWSRTFTGGKAIWNPTASPVTVIENGYKRFNCTQAPFLSQSAAINNGATAGGAGFSLAANSGIVLINE